MCSKINWTSRSLGACLEEDRTCFDFLLILCSWRGNNPKQNKLKGKLAVMSKCYIGKFSRKYFHSVRYGYLHHFLTASYEGGLQNLRLCQLSWWYFNIFPRHNTQSFDDFSGSSLNFCKFNFRLSKCLDTNNGKKLEFHSLVCRKLLRDFKNFVKQTQIIEEEKGKSIRLQFGVLGDNIAILALFLRFLSRDVAW